MPGVLLARRESAHLLPAVTALTFRGAKLGKCASWGATHEQTVQSACHLVKLLTHPKLPTDRRDEAFRIAAAHDLLDHFDDFDFWGTTPNEAEGAV